LFYGQTQIGGELASILNATAPLWVVLLAHHFTDDEKLTTLRAISTPNSAGVGRSWSWNPRQAPTLGPIGNLRLDLRP